MHVGYPLQEMLGHRFSAGYTDSYLVHGVEMLQKQRVILVLFRQHSRKGDKSMDLAQRVLEQIGIGGRAFLIFHLGGTLVAERFGLWLARAHAVTMRPMPIRWASVTGSTNFGAMVID